MWRRIATMSFIACAGCAAGEELSFLAHSDAGGGSTVSGSTSGTVGSSTSAGTNVAGTTSSTSGSDTAGTSGGAGGANTTAGGGAKQDGSVLTGSGGAAGSVGTGGFGGQASDASVDRFIPPPAAGFRVLYKAVGTNPMASAIQAETTIEDTGPDTVLLNELTLRYFFTDEIVGTPAIDIGFSGLNPGFRDLVPVETKQVGKVSNPSFTADSYVEFGWTAAAGSIAPAQSVIISWQYHGPTFSPLTQSNDYSFDATKTVAAPWDRVVLLRRGSVVWGTPP